LRRYNTEFHVVRKLLDAQVHERFSESRELRLTLQTVSMKMQVGPGGLCPIMPIGFPQTRR
jgi:hypothetical protein